MMHRSALGLGNLKGYCTSGQTSVSDIIAGVFADSCYSMQSIFCALNRYLSFHIFEGFMFKRPAHNGSNVNKNISELLVGNSVLVTFYFSGEYQPVGGQHGGSEEAW